MDFLIRKATISDKRELQELWYQAFLEHETVQSIDYYFENHFVLDTTFVLEVNKVIVATLQLNQHELMFTSKKEKVSFLVGVATRKECQSQGYMRKLLEYAMAYVRDILGQEIMILQAYNWDIYRKFGFEPAYYKKEILLEKKLFYQGKANEIIPLDLANCLDIYQVYTKDFTGYKVRDLAYFKDMLATTQVEESEFINSKQAYLVFKREENRINVSECAYKDAKALLILLDNLFNMSGVEKILVYTDININIINSSQDKLSLFMMMRTFNEDRKVNLESLYISEMI